MNSRQQGTPAPKSLMAPHLWPSLVSARLQGWRPTTRVTLAHWSSSYTAQCHGPLGGSPHPHRSPHHRSPPLSLLSKSESAVGPALVLPVSVTGVAGLPCWGVLLAEGSPSTYPAQLPIGRRSTCFLTTLSPARDRQDSVREVGTSATRSVTQPQEGAEQGSQ